MGKVLAVCISEHKGTIKTPVPSAHFVENFGIANDAHAGCEPLRQVSLLSLASMEKMKKDIPTLTYGSFAENLLVDGIDCTKLPLGTILKVGEEVILAITQIGKHCHNSGCAIKRSVGSCVMPKEGIFAKVVHGGIVHTDDPIVLS